MEDKQYLCICNEMNDKFLVHNPQYYPYEEEELPNEYMSVAHYENIELARKCLEAYKAGIEQRLISYEIRDKMNSDEQWEQYRHIKEAKLVIVLVREVIEYVTLTVE